MKNLPVTLDRESPIPLYRQIVDRIRSDVARGLLRPGDRLPTTRELARSLGINRLTVSRAYSQLSEEGAIASHVGRGTYVADGGGRDPDERGDRAAGVAWESLFSRTPERAFDKGLPPVVIPNTGPGPVSFASLFPDPALFPVEEFRASVDRVLRKEGSRVLAYGPPAGYPPLRRMIAGMLRSKGIHASEEEIVITSGSQQGIDLVARALIDPGDTVVVENPTFLGAVQVFQSLGSDLAGVPVDEQGALVGRLEQTALRRHPKLAYLMPSFQNPTSHTMSVERREALLSVASRERFVLLEDDFASDLRFEGTDLPPLRAMQGGESVIYLSTFGKKFLPGLRVGWLLAPRALVSRLVNLKKITDYGTSLLPQAALFEFCRQGALDRHLERVVNEYRTRRDTMLSAMKAEFPEGTTWTRPEGGLSIWVTLPAGVDADEIAAEAESRSVLVGRGDLFYVDGAHRANLRLAYSQARPERIREGIRILGEIIKRKAVEGPQTRESGRWEPLPLI